ncbi:phosphoesterase PA-phosphatase related [Opitutus terrae PB90-1]|uniref:Phosphoesterase PA-phosphatase related n=2 Tax=Opitutus terrae TaxID=107709 RepID=B1ZQ73_OPITP|nr:phosphoesterase PA-phosphatase related [Opitutus terrae PB90-1]
MTHRLAATAAALLLALTAQLHANEALHWNRVACGATEVALPLDPMAESRVLAIVHTAMHDAANATHPRYHTYGAEQPQARGGSAEAAVATAAHVTLSALLPKQRALFDHELTSSLQQVSDGEAKQRGIAAGQTAAAWLLQARQQDGAQEVGEYAPRNEPGDYRPTPPDFTPAVAAGWGRVKPFVLTASAQFRPAPPPAVGSPRALADLEEVRLIGGEKSDRRTHEQSEIACFWYENSTCGWNRIAANVGAQQKLDLWDQARLLALVNLAMADGFIGGFEAKYHYHYWRPATAIREAGHAEWLSQLFTPPVPDYPSTHTVLGGAVAATMARFFGTDFVSFATTSGGPYPGITRRFWSFSQAARENGASRVLAGIHFASAVEAGYRQGAEIGTWVFERALQPLNRPALTASTPHSAAATAATN